MLFPRQLLKLSLPKQLLDTGNLPAASGSPPHTDIVDGGGGGPSDLPVFMFRCFGAQAVMTGLLLSVATFDRQAYKVVFASILPFFVFDVAAWRAGYLTDLGALGDAGGNIVFTVASALGAGWLTRGRK